VIQTLVLFDIDGTLLSSDASGRSAIRLAFAEEFGDLDFLESVRFDGKTDPQIIRELCLAAGAEHRVTDATVASLLSRYVTYLEHELNERKARVTTLPGVVALLDTLQRDRSFCVGLLTGNVKAGARLKLAAAGIDFDQFEVGAFGCDSAHRPELPPIAAARAAGHFGRQPSGDDVVIIGDTPADVTCGNSIGARAIAVATGSYSEATLADAGAHATFATLEPTDLVMAAIR
jgi:phosphoglycolate phosphatase-like HAD superfamily hydrolase